MSLERDINSYPTVGQLEREVAQKINSLYYSELAHRASRVDCHLLDSRLIIFVEDVITPVEEILKATSTWELLNQVRTLLDTAIKPKLERLIEDTTKVKVNKFIYNTNTETDSAIAIVILARAPQVRPKKAHRRKNIVQCNKPTTRFDYGNEHQVESLEIKVNLEHKDLTSNV